MSYYNTGAESHYYHTYYTVLYGICAYREQKNTNGSLTMQKKKKKKPQISINSLYSTLYKKKKKIKTSRFRENM